MNTISLGPYTDIASLRQSIDVLYNGLQAGHILVALPQETQKIDVRIASVWERIRCWIRFKPVPIRLTTIQPILSQFFKTNEHLLASDPDLYPKLLTIYTNSVCKREEKLPCCFTQKTPPHQPINPDHDDRLITFEAAEGNVCKEISVPYKLFESLPSSDLQRYIHTHASPEKICVNLQDHSEATLNLFVTYQRDGQLEQGLSPEALIDLAQLAVGLGQKNLTKKILILLIASLSPSNYGEILPDLIDLIILEEFRPYIDTPDQWMVTSLVSQLKKIKNSQKLTNLDDFSSSVKFLKKNAPDDWIAKYLLAQFYEYGIGVERNFEKAFQLYKDLSDRGHSWGQCDLGRCYQYRDSNFDEAFRLYTLAANQGLSSAHYFKTVCYTHGKGTRPDAQAALATLQKLAKEGYPPGLYGLGNFYRNGTVVKKDPVKAVKFYELAGEDSKALYELGLCYEHGLVVEKNPKEAFKRYHAAAVQTLVEAEYKLGWCYLQGPKKENNIFGIKRDITEAKYWLTRATKQFHLKAKTVLDRLVLNPNFQPD
jgi:TPR repeat protein